MEKFSIENILNIGKIGNELELEQANSIFNKLRILMKDDSSLKPLRKHLADLIEAYEAKYWANEEEITEEQILTSDNAERIIQYQDQFIQKRKELIKNTLKSYGLNQNDFANILGHRKNYVSELINGLRPFSQEDSVVIHRIFGIQLDQLIIPIVKEPTADRIRLAIQKLNQPDLKLKSNEIIFPNYIIKKTNRKLTRSKIARKPKELDFQVPNNSNVNWEAFSRMKENRGLISVTQ